jgi:hypothetical protein
MQASDQQTFQTVLGRGEPQAFWLQKFEPTRAYVPASLAGINISNSESLWLGHRGDNSYYDIYLELVYGTYGRLNDSQGNTLLKNLPLEEKRQMIVSMTNLSKPTVGGRRRRTRQFRSRRRKSRRY